jgi:hypothetical protein
MDNPLVIALIKNPMFYYRSEHIDIRFHYIWDCITNKKVEVKYLNIQDQITYIFTKPLKHNVFTKMIDMLGVIKKSKLRGMLKVN